MGYPRQVMSDPESQTPYRRVLRGAIAFVDRRPCGTACAGIAITKRWVEGAGNAQQVFGRRSPSWSIKSGVPNLKRRKGNRQMRTFLTALLSVTLLLGIAGTAYAKKKKYKPRRSTSAQVNSPSAIYARQQDARTFDETQYFERDSNKIPFGTRAWWEQKTRETGNVE
jgi:hypothetical protein